MKGHDMTQEEQAQAHRDRGWRASVDSAKARRWYCTRKVAPLVAAGVLAMVLITGGLSWREWLFPCTCGVVGAWVIDWYLDWWVDRAVKRERDRRLPACCCGPHHPQDGSHIYGCPRWVDPGTVTPRTVTPAWCLRPAWVQAQLFFF